MLACACAVASPALALDRTILVINASPSDLASVGITGIDGSGVKIGQIESGVPQTTHVTLAAASITTKFGSPSSDHATAVAGAIVSQDATRTGIAPEADLFSAAIASGTRADQVVVAGDWTLSNGVKIINQSNLDSSSMASDGDGTSKETKYVDWLAYNHDIIFVLASGNVSGVVKRPADSYNSIVVGATGPGGTWNQVTSFSSGGTTADGRIKPDIVAPGQNVVLPSKTLPPFVPATGTSFAAPHVTGAAALLVQYGDATAGHSTDHKVIKAILLNSASKDGGEKPGETAVLRVDGTSWKQTTPGTNALDGDMGAGQLNAMAAFLQYKRSEASSGVTTSDDISISTIGWDLEQVEVGTTVDYEVQKTLAADSKITVTLIWDRHITRVPCTGMGCGPEEDTFTATALSNLDLILVDSEGNEVRETDTLGRVSYSESVLDSVEHIYFDLPEKDDYTVRVRNVSGLTETFAIAIWAQAVPALSLGLIGALAFALARSGQSFLRQRTAPNP